MALGTTYRTRLNRTEHGTDLRVYICVTGHSSFNDEMDVSYEDNLTVAQFAAQEIERLWESQGIGSHRCTTRLQGETTILELHTSLANERRVRRLESASRELLERFGYEQGGDVSTRLYRTLNTVELQGQSFGRG